MRAPIGLKIRNQRKSLGLSQSGLAQSIGISPSYLNLIERNKRDVGGKLLHKIAASIDLDLDQLSGESEQRLILELEEAFTDPVFEGLKLNQTDSRDLVAQSPKIANAIARLYRSRADANASLDAQATRLRSDPLFSQLLHQILSQITAIRSTSEILEDVGGLSTDDRQRFMGTVSREARALSDVAQTLAYHFDQSSQSRRSISPTREVDDLIIHEKNFFPKLEEAAEQLCAALGERNGSLEFRLTEILAKDFDVSVALGSPPRRDETGFPGQFQFDPTLRTMWFEGSTNAATRQFQLARLYGELGAADALNAQINDERLTSPSARRLAYRAMGSYLAGAIVMPYSAFLSDAKTVAYDLDALAQLYSASFEQVAHRLTTMRRKGEEGIPFGFLRSDPAGRLSKHFPLPGLLLPNSGHACPLLAICTALGTPTRVVRQVAQFVDGSRYLFVAKTISKRSSTFEDQPFNSTVMIACDILQADKTVYGRDLNLANQQADVPVGPGCRLCVRRECAYRQEEAFDSSSGKAAERRPLVPQGFEQNEKE